jgi:Flp pilus assembly protein CpaB
VTVRANVEIALHGLLMPGSRVDIMTVVRDAKDSSKSESKIFLQNIKVLAVNTLSERPEDKANVQNPISVTLALTPEQAERLYWVSSRTAVGMMMRKPGDAAVVDTKGARSPYGEQKGGGATPGEKSQTVYVASKDVVEGVKISNANVDEYFTTVTLNQGQIIGTFISDRSELENKTVTRFLARGQFASPMNFAAPGVEPVVVADPSRPFIMTIISGGQSQVFKFGGEENAQLPPGRPSNGNQGGSDQGGSESKP